MFKVTAARLFVISLTLFLVAVSVITAYADIDYTQQDSASAEYYAEPSEESFSTESTTPTTEPIIPADFPALTVNAISNFFPKSSAEYNVNTREVTVTYWLRSTKDVLSVQWYLTYDSEVLTFSLEKNPSRNICPSIGDSSILSFPDKNTLGYCATSMTLFDFSTQDMPFVQLVFDVNTLNPDEPVSTKVDLTIESLMVSDIDSATGRSDSDSELTVVDNSIEIGDLDPLFERITKMTTLTASNFVQATSAPPQPDTVLVTDESGSVVAVETVEPLTTESSTAATGGTAPSEPFTAEPTVQPTNPEPADRGKVSTGDIGYAWICLGVITISSIILFIMRKKEIMF